MSGYLTLDGTADNHPAAPDSAALSIAGDIFIAIRCSMADVTPGTDQTLVAKWEDTGDQRAYRLMVDTTGVLRLGWTPTGAAAGVVESDSTVAPSWSNDDVLWVAATLDVSSGDVKFFTGGSGATPSWTQLGTTVAGAGATSIADTSAVLEVGSDNTGDAQNLIGDVYNVIIEDGYESGVGTEQLNIDFTDLTPKEVFAKSFTEDSSNAATITLNGAAWVYNTSNVSSGALEPRGTDTDGAPLLSHVAAGLESALSGTSLVAAPTSPKVIVVDEIIFSGNTVATDVWVMNNGDVVFSARLGATQGAPIVWEGAYVCDAATALTLDSSTASEFQCLVKYHVLTP